MTSSRAQGEIQGDTWGDTVRYMGRYREMHGEIWARYRGGAFVDELADGLRVSVRGSGAQPAHLVRVWVRFRVRARVRVRVRVRVRLKVRFRDRVRCRVRVTP